MNKTEHAVVSVVGKDTVGILAKAATCCADANANVIEVTQSVQGNFFTMMMLIDLAELKGSIEDLQASIEAALPDMQTYVMHENIFNAMHRI